MNLAVLLVATCVANAAHAQCQTTWESGIGTLGTNGTVYALAVLPSGDLIVGGAFTTAGGVAGRNRIARVNPTTGVWSGLGAGTDSLVSTLAVVSSTEVLVGGPFQMAGGVTRPYLATVNPTTGSWTGSSIAVTNGSVNAIAIRPNGDRLYGGAFTQALGNPANRVVLHTPSTNVWQPCGQGVTLSTSLNCYVNTLTMLPNGDVIVGGRFDSAGGVANRNSIAKLSGTSTWSGLGSGVTFANPIQEAEVAAVAVLPNGDYLVGGFFDRAGGVTARSIARFNPTTSVWSAIGNVDGRVHAFASLPGGDVIVAGDFSAVNGILASNIARYNPATGVWSALGAGTNDIAFSLAVQSNGGVVIGGIFTSAGGSTANSIARITPGANAPSINFQPLPVITAPTATVKFGISAAAGFGSSATPTYQWKKGGVPIDTATNSSAATPILTLTNVQASDVGSYTCVVTNSCGGLGTESAAAPLSFGVDPCQADFNEDGVVDFFDYLDFVAAFSVGC